MFEILKCCFYGTNVFFKYFFFLKSLAIFDSFFMKSNTFYITKSIFRVHSDLENLEKSGNLILPLKVREMSGNLINLKKIREKSGNSIFSTVYAIWICRLTHKKSLRLTWICRFTHKKSLRLTLDFVANRIFSNYLLSRCLKRSGNFLRKVMEIREKSGNSKILKHCAPWINFPMLSTLNDDFWKLNWLHLQNDDIGVGFGMYIRIVHTFLSMPI